MVEIDLRHGFKQYAQYTESCYYGCHNNCRYCFVRFDSCIRYKTRNWNQWDLMILHKKNYRKGYGNRIKGATEFPSSHDIFPFNKAICFKVIKKIINPKPKILNQFLLVSKPRLKVFKAFHKKFKQYKDIVLDNGKRLVDIRLTITSINNDLIKFWECNAPLVEERIKVLEFLYEKEWEVSVSQEPYLDPPEDIPILVDLIRPHISKVLWLGYMTRIRSKGITNEEKPFYNDIRENRSKANLIEIVNSLRNYKEIKYKSQMLKKSFLLNLIPEYQKPFLEPKENIIEANGN